MGKETTPKINVISKGEYSYKQTNEFLPVGRFLIIRKKNRRFLLLDFENRKEETLTGLSLQIDQFDSHGNPLGARLAELKDLAFKKGKFILKRKIELHSSCLDFRLKILAAEYGNYTYRLGEDDVYVTYEKRKSKPAIDKEKIEKQLGQEGISVKSRRFGIPAAVGVFAGVAVAAAAIISYVHLKHFKENENSFFLSNIEYEFIDGNNAADAPVNVVGYVGYGGKKIVIPNTIEGHPVVKVSDMAFASNTIIEEVSVQSGVVIESNAFYNCDKLKKVVVADDVLIGNYAFSDCDKLTSFEGKNLTQIGNGAFYGCSSLSSVRLEGDEDKTLYFGEDVFGGCTDVRNIYIDQFIQYGESCAYFADVQEIDSLYLKNYNYLPYEINGVVNKGLSALFDGGVEIKSLHVGYTEDIPASFTADCGTVLESVKIDNMTGSTVGNYAFSDCGKLKTLSLPKAMTVVGEGAFQNSGLASFNGTELTSLGYAAFKDCVRLTEFSLSDTTALTAIPESAFNGCTRLKEIKLPKTVQSIGREAFNLCSSLASVTFAAESELTTIGEFAFFSNTALKTLDLPDQLQTLEKGALSDCRALRMLYIPASVTSIDSTALEYCYRLYEIENLSDILILAGYGLGANTLKVYNSATEPRMEKHTVGTFVLALPSTEWYLIEYGDAKGTITLPDGIGGELYKIVSYLFLYDTRVTEVNVSNDAAWIGKNVFADSKVKKLHFASGSEELQFTADSFADNSLETVDFGTRTFPSVPAHTFYESNTLKEITLSPSVQAVGVSAFENCTALKSVKLPYGLFAIEDSAFAGCNALGEITIPTSVTTLGEQAFLDCYSLKTVADASGLTSLGARVFSGCAALESISVSRYVADIPESAFAGCTSLKSMRFAEGLTSVSFGAFYGCTALEQVYLPSTLETIADEAFTGCKTLHEVYDLTDHLSVSCDSRAYGNVGYNAIVVHTAADADPLQKTTINGFVFKYANGIWAIVDYTGDKEAIVLENMSGNGQYVEYYGVARYAFENKAAITSITVGSAVHYMRSYAFSGLYNLSEVRFAAAYITVGEYTFADCPFLKRLVIPKELGGIEKDAFSNSDPNIYYTGTLAEWETNRNKYAVNYNSVYYYDACGHDYGEWNYDKNGNLNTVTKDYQLRVLQAPTCTKNGYTQYYCDDCSDTWKETNLAYGHSYSDSECTRCGYVYNLFVTSSSLSHAKELVSVTNSSKSPFDLFQKGYSEIASTNTGENSTATLTLKAKEAIVIRFVCRTFGASYSMLTVETSGGSRTTLSGYDSQSFTFTLQEGDTITFVYQQTVAQETDYATIESLYISSAYEPY